MKKLFLSSSLTMVSVIAFAQTIPVTGTVKDASGKPVIFAFIVDSQHPYATFSDSTGAFFIKADPTSQLIITAKPHSATQVKIDNPSDLKVVLTGNSPASLPIPPNEKNLFSTDEASAKAGGSFTGIGAASSGTHGSRFLFNNWVHGFAITPGNTIKNDDYWFNYDKVDGNLMFSRDRASLHQTIHDEVAGFTLFDNNTQPYPFESVPAIDAKHYMMVLSSGPKYKVYKDLGVKFVKANFTTNGISSSGNNYDEFAEDPAYYVVKLPGGVPQKISLKKKSIKAAFPAEADKINKYLNDNDRDYDDNYLKGLGDFMNQ